MGPTGWLTNHAIDIILDQIWQHPNCPRHAISWIAPADIAHNLLKPGGHTLIATRLRRGLCRALGQPRHSTVHLTNNAVLLNDCRAHAVLIPIRLVLDDTQPARSGHWALLHVDFHQHTYTLHDSKPEYFMTHRPTLKAITQAIAMAYGISSPPMTPTGTQTEPSKAHRWLLDGPDNHPGNPTQPNGRDCGIYLCRAAALLLHGCVPTQDHYPQNLIDEARNLIPYLVEGTYKTPPDAWRSNDSTLPSPPELQHSPHKTPVMNKQAPSKHDKDESGPTESNRATNDIIRNVITSRARAHARTWQAARQDPLSTARTLCDNYADAEYTSLAADTTRNTAYRLAIHSLPPDRANIDIGTGKHALLAKLVLQRHDNCLAIEAAPATAHSARQALRQDESTQGKEWQVITAYSTDASTNTITAHTMAKPKGLNVAHEILGPIASLEGAPKALHELITRQCATTPRTNITVCPAMYGTLITPVTIPPQNICEPDTYINAPNLILTTSITPNKHGMTDASKAFEWYDYTNLLNMPQLTQHRTLTFDISKTGTVHALLCHIHVTLSTAHAHRGTHGCTLYPYGDTSLPHLRKPISITSNRDSNMAASNWRNPLLILPHALQVATNDRITIHTTTKANSDTPAYNFSITHTRKNQHMSTQHINMKHPDFYPFYALQNTNSSPAHTCARKPHNLISKSAPAAAMSPTQGSPTIHTCEMKPRPNSHKSRKLTAESSTHNNNPSHDRADTKTRLTPETNKPTHPHKKENIHDLNSDSQGDDSSDDSSSDTSSDDYTERGPCRHAAQTKGRKPKRIRRTKRAPTIEFPRLTKQGKFSWAHTGIAAVASKKKNKGQALAATKPIATGTMFPILGIPVTNKLLHDLATKHPHGLGCEHAWKYQGPRHPAGIVGGPHLLPHNGVGCLGAAIVMLANEPTASKPNCIFKYDCLITTKPIKAGQELQVWYGPDYDPIRKQKGYFAAIQQNKHITHGPTVHKTLNRLITFDTAATYASLIKQGIDLVDTALCNRDGIESPYGSVNDWTLVAVPQEEPQNLNKPTRNQQPMITKTPYIVPDTPSQPARLTRSTPRGAKPQKESDSPTALGNEPNRGYLYDPADTSPPIRIQRAHWLPVTAGKHGRGLFAKIKFVKGMPITPYSGTVHTNYAYSPDNPDQCAFVIGLHNTQAGRTVLDGFREPTPGMGMAQFCNDSRTPKTYNAALKTSDGIADAHGKHTHAGAWIEATKTIFPGQEIFVNYGNVYWNRYLTYALKHQDNTHFTNYTELPLEAKLRRIRARIQALNHHSVNTQVRPTKLSTTDPLINYGVYATKNIPTNTPVATYTGEHITNDTYNMRYPNDEPNYVFTLVKDAIHVDATVPEHASIARWINGTGPQDQPNCVASRHNGNMEKLIVIKTCKAIKAGDQLLYDYGNHYHWKPDQRLSLQNTTHRPAQNIPQPPNVHFTHDKTHNNWSTSPPESDDNEPNAQPPHKRSKPNPMQPKDTHNTPRTHQHKSAPAATMPPTTTGSETTHTHALTPTHNPNDPPTYKYTIHMNITTGRPCTIRTTVPRKNNTNCHNESTHTDMTQALIHTQERKLKGYTLPPETLSTHIPTCYLYNTPQEAQQSTLWTLLKQATEPIPQDEEAKHPRNGKHISVLASVIMHMINAYNKNNPQSIIDYADPTSGTKSATLPDKPKDCMTPGHVAAHTIVSTIRLITHGPNHQPSLQAIDWLNKTIDHYYLNRLPYNTPAPGAHLNYSGIWEPQQHIMVNLPYHSSQPQSNILHLCYVAHDLINNQDTSSVGLHHMHRPQWIKQKIMDLDPQREHLHSRAHTHNQPENAGYSTNSSIHTCQIPGPEKSNRTSDTARPHRPPTQTPQKEGTNPKLVHSTQESTQPTPSTCIICNDYCSHSDSTITCKVHPICPQCQPRPTTAHTAQGTGTTPCHQCKLLHCVGPPSITHIIAHTRHRENIIANPRGVHTQHSPTLQRVVMRHTHTHKILNSSTVLTPPNTTWHSPFEGDTHIGAINGPIKNFLQHNYVWVNPTAPHVAAHHLKEAIRSATESTQTTRTCILTLLPESTLNTHGEWNTHTQTHTTHSREVNKTILRTFAPHTIVLINTNTNRGAESYTHTLNQTPAHLLLIETGKPKPFNMQKLQKDLDYVINRAGPTNITYEIPAELETPDTHYSYHTQRHSTQHLIDVTWTGRYPAHPQPITTRQSSVPHPPQHETHNREENNHDKQKETRTHQQNPNNTTLADMLGLYTTTTCKTRLLKNGYNIDEISKELLEKIRKRHWQALIQSYIHYHNHRLHTLYGQAPKDDGEEPDIPPEPPP